MADGASYVFSTLQLCLLFITLMFIIMALEFQNEKPFRDLCSKYHDFINEEPENHKAVTCPGSCSYFVPESKLEALSHRGQGGVYSRSRLTDSVAGLLCAGGCHQAVLQNSVRHPLLGCSFPFLRESRILRLPPQ